MPSIPASADHERREQLRSAVEQLEAIHKFLQPGTGEADNMKFARLGIEDVISDITGEIKNLTDAIGDERGDERVRAA